MSAMPLKRLQLVPQAEAVAENASPHLTIRGVSKTFVSDNGSFEALSPIELTVRKGEFACLLGPSGCGKSTLLNLIAGLEPSDAGVIELNGKPVSGTAPDRLVIFQEAALFPWLTVQGNVEFGLQAREIPKKERYRQARNMIEMVGLTQFAEAYPHQLSGGMKQRAAIARGLVLDPEVLLMDEPFAALDAQTRDRLHEELQRIWIKTGKTILFVTHNVREASCLADRIFLMSPHPGRIVREYKVDLKRPRSLEDPGVMELAREITHDLKSYSTGEAG